MRIAVVGARGKMGRHYVRLLEQQHDVVEVEIGDSIADAARAVDAGIIASPTILHYDHAAEFLRNGVPVLIEKPIALNVCEARLLVDLADFQGVPVAVGYLERFNPAVIEAADDLVNCNAFTMARFGPTVPSVYGPVSIDLASHDLDLLRYILGDAGFRAKPYSATWDTSGFRIETIYDALGNVYSARGVHSTKVFRKWVLDGDQEVEVDLTKQTVIRDGVAVPLATVNQLEEQITAFLGMVHGIGSRIATAEDGLKVLELIEGNTQA